MQQSTRATISAGHKKPPLALQHSLTAYSAIPRPEQPRHTSPQRKKRPFNPITAATSPPSLAQRTSTTQQAIDRANDARSCMPLLFYLCIYITTYDPTQVRARHSSDWHNQCTSHAPPFSNQRHSSSKPFSSQNLLFNHHAKRRPQRTVAAYPRSAHLNKYKPAIAPATLATTCPYYSTSIHIRTTHDQGKYGHDTVDVALAIARLPADHEQQASNRTSNACHHMPLLFYLFTYAKPHTIKASRGTTQEGSFE